MPDRGYRTLSGRGGDDQIIGRSFGAIGGDGLHGLPRRR